MGMALTGLLVGKINGPSKSPPKKKGWQSQRDKARMKRLDNNKWKYQTQINASRKRKALARVKSPVPKRKRNGGTPTIDGVNGRNSPGFDILASKRSGRATEEAEPKVLSKVMSERELNLMVVMQKVKSRPKADDKKLYEEDFYMWQANNPTTFRLHPIVVDYEENGDRLEHAEFYINDGMSMSITFLE